MDVQKYVELTLLDGDEYIVYPDVDRDGRCGVRLPRYQ